MKIVVDRDKCQGHAVCASHAPDLYRLDDLGYNSLTGVVDVEGPDAELATRGARACPERAITIVVEG